MSKYIAPSMEINEVYCDNIITVSPEAPVVPVTYESLPGVDEGDSKSAVFNVGLWM